jgi:flagellar hook-associated protein 1 FlgK
MYESLAASVARDASRYAAETEGLKSFHAVLQSEHLAVTGVNIDEESIRMLTYQRSFQASSRVIATAVEMLEMLVNL